MTITLEIDEWFAALAAKLAVLNRLVQFRVAHHLVLVATGRTPSPWPDTAADWSI